MGVNPARAGMILALVVARNKIWSKPRASGDDPTWARSPSAAGRKPRASGDDPALAAAFNMDRA